MGSRDVSRAFVLVVIPFLLSCCKAYQQSSPPVNYCDETVASETCQSNVALYVDRLKSEKSLIPYEHNHFDFCRTSETVSPLENFRQVLALEDGLRLSTYKITFLKNVECETLCQKIYKVDDKQDHEKLQTLKHGMLMNYQHNWVVDEMPVIHCYAIGLGQYCSVGFPIGCYVPPAFQARAPDACVLNTAYSQADTFYLFNHVDIQIHYHSGESEPWGMDFQDKGGRIIKIKVQPRSIKHMDGQGCMHNLPPMAIHNKPQSGEVITVNYTYSVSFVKDNTIKWSSRWDYILENPRHMNYHVFGIVNLLLIAVFLAVVVAVIMHRIVHKETSGKNELKNNDVQNEFGWKLVHGNVFQPPTREMLLSVFLGSGIQVLLTTLVILLVACLGFLSPVDRRTFVTCIVVAYASLGTSAGYTSSRMYKDFGGRKWKTNLFFTAVLCPGVMIGLFLGVNLLFYIKGGATVPFVSMTVLFAVWFGLLFPSVFLGGLAGYIVFKKKDTQQPSKTKQMPRQIPEKPICAWSTLGILLGGILPFGCIFTELYFILNSIWSSQIYSVFGFLLIVYLFLLTIWAEVAILLCHFQLRTEDHQWWWRSFLTTGSTALYLFLYCIYYFVTKLEITEVASVFVYFSFTLAMCFMFFLLAGAVGFLASLCFLRKMYGMVTYPKKSLQTRF